MATLYKWLGEDGRPFHGGRGQWSLPTKRSDGTWNPGRWMPRVSEVVPCESGYHGCEESALVWFIAPTLYEMEVRGERVDHREDDGSYPKFAVAQARLLRRVETWNERTTRLFAADCAEAVLPIFEARYPNDDRPSRAIEVTRRFARGEATHGELTAAGAAARDAARAAARDAAGAAAGDAAGDAARAAAGDAARAAARDAAWAAAGAAARAAAGAAARDAAWAAAGDAAGAAAWAAAWERQNERLLQYLNGEAE